MCHPPHHEVPQSRGQSIPCSSPGSMAKGKDFPGRERMHHQVQVRCLVAMRQVVRPAGQVAESIDKQGRCTIVLLLS